MFILHFRVPKYFQFILNSFKSSLFGGIAETGDRLYIRQGGGEMGERQFALLFAWQFAIY
jgi:hypothetical protein